MYGADVGNRAKSACHRSILFYLKMMVISILMLLCLFAFFSRNFKNHLYIKMDFSLAGC